MDNKSVNQTTEKEEEVKERKLDLTEEEKGYDFELLDMKIETIDDLIALGKKYDSDYKQRKKRFNLNMRVLAEMVEPLENLSRMIGMEKLKNAIFNKIILFLQGLDNRESRLPHCHMDHLVWEKQKCQRLLAIFMLRKMGILS